MMQRNRLNASYGITLIEMVIVLVITGMVIGGIWAGTAVAISNAKKKQFAEDILTTVENARNFLRQSGSIAEFANAGNSLAQEEAFAQVAFPASILNKPYKDHGAAVPGNYLNNYGNQITVYPVANSNGRSVSNYTLTVSLFGSHNALSTSACTDLLYNRLGVSQQLADSAGFISALIFGESIITLTPPFTLSAATTACTNVAWMTLSFRV